MNRSELMKKARAAADQVLRAKGYFSVVDVLLTMGRLSKENHERWCFRQVPHLEKVLPGSLNEHAFLCRELRALAHELRLKPNHTAYTSWGKGRRQPLRFTKYGHPPMEALFSTHYVSTSITDDLKSRRSQLPVPLGTKAQDFNLQNQGCPAPGEIAPPPRPLQLAISANPH